MARSRTARSFSVLGRSIDLADFKWREPRRQNCDDWTWLSRRRCAQGALIQLGRPSTGPLRGRRRGNIEVTLHCSKYAFYERAVIDGLGFLRQHLPRLFFVHRHLPAGTFREMLTQSASGPLESRTCDAADASSFAESTIWLERQLARLSKQWDSHPSPGISVVTTRRLRAQV